jgi:hypothetical protein
MSITFSSCFYILKSKFEPNIYIEWMNNFISIVNNFYLVIYTDKNSISYIDTKNNPKIKIIIKQLNEFYNYKYKDYWIKNHEKNFLLNDKSDWQLNMLWSEKISFVKETIERKYFNTELYGWCDIGYFRNRDDDISTSELMSWPDINKLKQLNKSKIVYACINNDDRYLNYIMSFVKNQNETGVPINQIPSNQKSIAGGFFILHKDMIDWWFDTFNSKLSNYFKNNYLVKDDQIILVDCIFNNLDKFLLFREHEYPYDNWFMFQRLLN